MVGDNIYFVSEKSHVERALSVFGRDEEEARRVVIVGGGNVGAFIAQKLIDSDSNIQVKIIEVDDEKAMAIAKNIPKAIVLNGDALDVDIQKEANVKSAETIISVTNDDKVNILSALLAKQAGSKRAITLINNHSFGPLTYSVGIDAFVDPRQTTVSSILQHMRRGRIRSLQNLAGGAAEVLEAVALETSPLVGKPLREIGLPDGIIIGSVVRGKEVIVPRGGTIIKPDDIVVIFTRLEMIKKVEELFSVRLEYF
ncbi:Trk potassium uptake system protein TrkA [hydrothermal vent metagenome]|uniref:Trk potassium uptake system protein TrkA n=1 Tax=hydrothermal vent metagenome TaxID=652676 RepID=A0A3B0RSS7_9ZZZZ